MAKISSSNLKWYLSGGAGNTDPYASFGGARSTTLAPQTLNGLFDVVHGDEAAAGSVEYRCVYFRNEDANASGLMAPVSVWIASQTTSADTSLDIGLDPAGKNGEATTIATETAAPSGVSFSAPSAKGTLSLPGDPYAQNDYIAVWIRRTVNIGAASTALDEATVRVEGDTL
jgi:hypothetical protein